MTNYSHLSYEDRKNIEDGLNQNKSINQIAKELNRSHSTILREVDRNRNSPLKKMLLVLFMLVTVLLRIMI